MGLTIAPAMQIVQICLEISRAHARMIILEMELHALSSQMVGKHNIIMLKFSSSCKKKNSLDLSFGHDFVIFVVNRDKQFKKFYL